MNKLVKILDFLVMPKGSKRQFNKNKFDFERAYFTENGTTLYDSFKQVTYTLIILGNLDKLMELPKIIEKYII